jgi:hypothetical protein
MRKYKQFWFYLLLSLSISLTILVINNISQQKGIPPIIYDINSGVIGAILTTIITLILLANQTESQENLTKSSVVYEEKLKIFNGFLQTMGTCLEDGKLTAQEIQKIIHSFSILRVHISPESSKLLESTISSIDSSFFYVDENYIPNIERIIILYTTITNVFRKELYGDKVQDKLEPFNFYNFREILFRRRITKIKPNSFTELAEILKNNFKILHESSISKNTIVYDINEEIIHALRKFHDFIEQIASEIDPSIYLTYEINKNNINGTPYNGIPYTKLNYKDTYFGYFGLTETKRLLIGTKMPSTKQIASLELFEIDNLDNLKIQITKGIKDSLNSIEDSKSSKSTS